MKKLIITIMMLTGLQGFANGPKVPGQDGGGGGVIKRNGMYLTFGSAGMKVKLSSVQGMEQVPGLELILLVMDAQTSIDSRFKGQLLNGLLPSDARRYFKIDQSQLNSQTYTRLISEYSKLWKGQIDPTNLDLAAITIEDDTYLLPPFFQLKPSEQAAILFHESIWTIKRDITYQELVNAEIVMQSHIEKYGTQSIYNPDLLIVFGKIFNSFAVTFAAAIIEDIKAGNFMYEEEETVTIQVSKKKTETVTRKKGHLLDLRDMLANVSIECAYYNICTQPMSKEDQGVLALKLREGIKKYPKIKSIRLLYDVRTQISGIYLSNSYSYLERNTSVVVSENYKCVTLGYRNNICFK